MDYFVLIIAAIFVNNIVLAQYLGNCPFIGTSKESSVAIGMGLAVVFVAAMAACITWCVQKFMLAPNNLGYLQTIAFILVIAALVQFVEMFLKKRYHHSINHLASSCRSSPPTARYSVLLSSANVKNILS